MKIKEHVINILIFSPYIFLMVGINLFPDGDKKMVFFCILSIFTCIFFYKFNNLRENIKNPVLWGFATFSIYLSIFYLIQGGSPSLLRGFLAATLIMFFIPRLSRENLLYLAILGSGCLFLNSVYQSLYLGHSRSAGLVNVIPYATFCAVLFLIGIHFIIKSSNKKYLLLGMLIALLTITSIIFSLSRGVWLALLLATLAMVLHQLFIKKIQWQYISLITISIISILYIFNDPISNRAHQTANEFHEIRKGNLDTSIGLRLQMWEASHLILQENFWFGAGKKHQEILNDLHQQGEISRNLAAFYPQHYHNQLIDSMVKYGLVGAMFIMLLYLLPIIVSIKYKTNYTSLIIGVSVLYFIAGLTDVPLNHAETIFIYVILMITLTTCQKTKQTET